MIIKKVVSSILTVLALLFVSAPIVHLDTEDNKKGQPSKGEWSGKKWPDSDQQDFTGGQQMKWLEIIELRSSNHNSRTLEEDLVKLMKKMNCEGAPRSIKVYKHGTVETDFSVHLNYDTEPTDIRGSNLGLCLVSALKEFGLVNHAIWVERSI